MSIFKKAFESQVAKGMKVEKEHEDTLKWFADKIQPGVKIPSNLLEKAKKHIVGDHTEERADYYDGLDLAEKLPPKEIQKLRTEHHLT